MGKNGRKDIRHARMLQPSTMDMVKLAEALEERFLSLCKTYLREKHEELQIPKSLDADMFLWRTLVSRYKQGDFRNNRDEKKAVRRIAEWTHRVNCEVCNQEHVPTV